MDKRYANTYPFLKLFRNNKPSPADIKKPVQHESLDIILKDKLLCELFHDWAAQNLCAENLMFYFEVCCYLFVVHINFKLTFLEGREVQNH